MGVVIRQHFGSWSASFLFGSGWTKLSHSLRDFGL